MQQFLEQYGYLALLIGTFFEGETAILMASSLVYRGIFQLPATIAFAFAGSFISDWLYYLIGRLNGKYFVDKNQKVKQWMSPVSKLFIAYKIPLLLSYRFLYGFRIVVPVVIGMSGLRPIHFLSYSVVAGLIWSSLVSLTGYYLGMWLQLDASSFEKNLLYLLAGFATFGVLLGFIVKQFISGNYNFRTPSN